MQITQCGICGFHRWEDIPCENNCHNKTRKEQIDLILKYGREKFFKPEFFKELRDKNEK